LLDVLAKLRAAFPTLQRVSCYASPQALDVRSTDEMRALREAGLVLYYVGLESGDDAVLERLKKGADSAELARVTAKAHAADVKLSTMILLGAGGRARSREHALASARLVNTIRPRFVSTLVMTPVEGTPLFVDAERGEVDELSPLELAQELRDFLAALELDGTVFRSNHASNYLVLAGTLPKDQGRLVAALDAVLAKPGTAAFRRRRGL
jgi:radical SAM superfamily enzyme YgiQ (UPF0313 family)